MASTYLTRTPSSSSNRKTWTWSAWVKRGLVNGGSDQTLFQAYVDSSNYTQIRFAGGSDLIDIRNVDSGSVTGRLETTRVFRDTSAWYHIVVVWDTTNLTAGNRMRLYINGVEETSFSPDTNPNLNDDSTINENVVHWIGKAGFSGYPNYFDGSMAMVQFVDGQAYGPAYFGSTDSNTNIWTPTATSTISDYGTNGFKLAMDTSTPGADTSGKGNTFTASGTPTLLQGNPQNNWCTMNPLNPIYQGSASNGNTTVTGTTADNYTNSVISSMAFDKGKWYWETKYAVVNSNTNACVGAAAIDAPYQYNTNPTSALGGYISPRFDGELIYNASSTASYFPAITSAGTIIMQALDMDNKKYWLGINGSWYGTAGNTNGNPATGANPVVTFTEEGFWVPMYRILASKFECNFGEGFFGTTAAGTQADDNGQGLFAYDVPAGYYAMNTKNLEAYG